MKFLIPLATILSIGIVFFSSSGCSKTSEDKLAGPVVCDTTNVTYSGSVVPILQDNCYECHGKSSNSGSGGIVLEGYSNIKVYVDNGYVVGNITHAPGFIGMPYGRPKLPDCEINTILAWVHRGAPSN